MVTRTAHNQYGGLIETGIIRIAIKRLQRLGFPRHQWDDVLQELAIEILQFQFDPGRANGGKEATVLCRLIDNRLISLLRSQKRCQERLQQLRPRETHEENISLRLDVRDVVARLSPRQQAVCRGFARGDSITQIARDLGCGRATVRRIRDCVRREFQAVGLDGRV